MQATPAPLPRQWIELTENLNGRTMFGQVGVRDPDSPCEAFDPDRALSLHQPWAWLVVHGWKDLENRVWGTSYRGRFLIHAAKTLLAGEYEHAVLFAREVDPSIVIPPPAELERGGIVGVASLVDVIPPCIPFGYQGPEACRCGERWHMGEQYGFRLTDVEALPFRPARGLQRWFCVAPAPSDARNGGAA